MGYTERGSSVGVIKKISTIVHILLAYMVQFTLRKFDWEYFWNYVADLWMDVDSYHRAIVASRRAQQISDSPRASASIGWCYLQLGFPDLALPYLVAAWSKMKEPTLSLSILRCYWQLGNDKEAKQIVDFLDAFPPFQVPPSWFDEFNHIKKLLNAKSKEEIESVLAVKRVGGEARRRLQD